jgi:hypothetical protein
MHLMATELQVIPSDQGDGRLPTWSDVAVGKLSDGSPFPARIDVWAKVDEESPVILRLELDGGEPVLAEIRVLRNGPGSQVTSSLLRATPLAKLTEQAIEHVAEGYFLSRVLAAGGLEAIPDLIGGVGGWPETERTRQLAEALDAYRAQAKTRRRRKLTPEFLGEVAGVYLAAERYPSVAVRDHLKTSKRNAIAYIQAARAAGYLPAKEGRP